jgi:cell division GTPase FtsZ
MEGKERGILIAGTGSGAANIISEAYVEDPGIRNEKNCVYLVNSSEKDFRNVDLKFEFRRIHTGVTKESNFQTRVVGRGMGAGKQKDAGLGMYQDMREEILRDIERVKEEYDPFIAFTVGCLGGGFSSLAQAELARDLKETIGTDVIVISTLPRRAEGNYILDNAEAGMNRLLEYDFYPILYDNESPVRLRKDVGSIMRKSNNDIRLTMGNLISAIDYLDFAFPQVDITDLAGILKKEVSAFSHMETDDESLFFKEWKNYLVDRNFSLYSLPEVPKDGASALILYQGPEIQQRITEDVSKYFKAKFNASHIVSSVFESEYYSKYSITVVLSALSREGIRPPLRQPEYGWFKKLVVR